jgi:predicted molibdopterin-dependent oxidoreductase YjgC
MGFRDKDGAPLIGWSDPEGAFEAWKRCSRGRPCDYGAMTYDRLRGSGGIQWPCTDAAPAGTERLYTEGVFNTDPDYAETYGHDLKTGAAETEDGARAKQPAGRAYLQAAEYEPSPEASSAEYPLLLTTGRTVYHFQTRTKTGRTPELEAAAPEVWAELSAADAARLGVAEGDELRLASPRRTARAGPRHGHPRGRRVRPVPLRLLGSRPGRSRRGRGPRRQ